MYIIIVSITTGYIFIIITIFIDFPGQIIKMKLSVHFGHLASIKYNTTKLKTFFL